ncbi:MAG: YicC/YloC family endoribonuclease, partial [Lachnospiraceae bacterium]|nr:YicC/YloC family endoribonuclease [Lachnospiraceae bacterium]
MIRSMTGYGRAEAADEARKITAEIRAVNNRYADFNIRMPRKCIFLEQRIRSLLKERVLRGKVDVFISLEEFGDAAGSLRYNETLAGEYIEGMRSMIERFGLCTEIRAVDVARAPEVFSIGEADMDEDALWALMEPVICEAAERFNESREDEGEKLKADLTVKLDELYALTEEVIAHEPEIMAAYREKITRTLSEILEDRSIDEMKITAECALYADKICTDEETVRLKSHIVQMRAELEKDGSVGRKLDFIAQEMNREANTTLSKAGDLITADCGITMKTLIEKIREQ